MKRNIDEYQYDCIVLGGKNMQQENNWPGRDILEHKNAFFIRKNILSKNGLTNWDIKKEERNRIKSSVVTDCSWQLIRLLNCKAHN